MLRVIQYVGRSTLFLFQGFIVPDELGYLNNLGKYEDKDVVLQLPG
jgi:hypothetical protein